MQNKNITPRNTKGQRHGLWEEYFPNGKLDHKGLFINGKAFGKHESYYHDGRLHYIMKFINDEHHGYYEYYFLNGNIDKEYHAR